jgi:hypothetical protein
MYCCRNRRHLLLSDQQSQSEAHYRPCVGAWADIRKRVLAVKSGHRLTAWINSARLAWGFGLTEMVAIREAVCFVLPGNVVRSFSMPINGKYWEGV